MRLFRRRLARSLGRYRTALIAAALLLVVAGAISYWAAAAVPRARPAPAPRPPAGQRVGLDRELVEKYRTEPVISVYHHATGSRLRMPMERYLTAVVAAETVSGWEDATLEAQAIVARTFTLWNLESGDSVPRQLHGTDVCTSKDHFQAYDPRQVDAAIRQAVENTRGVVLAFEQDLALTYFSSASGGTTAGLLESFPASRVQAPYLTPRPSRDQEIAPSYARSWSIRVTRARLRVVMGRRAGTAGHVVIESRGPSGRAEAIRVGDARIHAAELRQRLGADVLRSTMITSISVGPVYVTFRGVGWGHGVGLDQWGAEAMARDGMGHATILAHYFPGTRLVQLWP